MLGTFTTVQQRAQQRQAVPLVALLGHDDAHDDRIRRYHPSDGPRAYVRARCTACERIVFGVIISNIGALMNSSIAKPR